MTPIQQLSRGLETELKQAYEALVEVLVPHWDTQSGPLSRLTRNLLSLYQRALTTYQYGGPQNELIADRWAKSVKHLALVCQHEAKIAYLSSNQAKLPPSPFSRAFVSEGKTACETARSLLDNAGEKLFRVSHPLTEGALEMLKRGRQHLNEAIQNPIQNDLLKAERIRAAYEYGRTLEYLLLAIEAEGEPHLVAA